MPVNLEMLASFRNAQVTVLDQEQAETIMWDGRHFVIRVRRADNDGRQRFSCAHGIIHTYFMEAGSGPQAGGNAHDSWSRQEEDLCDQGAAELLLPRAAFIAACPARPDMEDVLTLAEEFEASAEATAPVGGDLMASVTDDLIAFLTARLDEDGAAAKAATPGPWAFEGDDPTDDELYSVYDGEHGDLVGVTVAFTRDRQVANGQHMARHDPARALRKVAAGRRRLELHHPVMVDYIDGDCIERGSYECAECEPPGMPDNWPCPTIRADLAVWSDHPDYRQEWAPLPR